MLYRRTNPIFYPRVFVFFFFFLLDSFANVFLHKSSPFHASHFSNVCLRLNEVNKYLEGKCIYFYLLSKCVLFLWIPDGFCCYVVVIYSANWYVWGELRWEFELWEGVRRGQIRTTNYSSKVSLFLLFRIKCFLWPGLSLDLEQKLFPKVFEMMFSNLVTNDRLRSVFLENIRTRKLESLHREECIYLITKFRSQTVCKSDLN